MICETAKLRQRIPVVPWPGGRTIARWKHIPVVPLPGGRAMAHQRPSPYRTWSPPQSPPQNPTSRRSTRKSIRAPGLSRWCTNRPYLLDLTPQSLVEHASHILSKDVAGLRIRNKERGRRERPKWSADGVQEGGLQEGEDRRRHDGSGAPRSSAGSHPSAGAFHGRVLDGVVTTVGGSKSAKASGHRSCSIGKAIS